MKHAFDEDYVDAENWVDLHVGATGTCFARLDQIAAGSGTQPPYDQPAVVLGFSDWSSLVVQISRDGFDLLSDNIRARENWLNSHVLVRVRRTEDGVEGIAIRKIDTNVWAPLTTVSATAP